MFHCTHCDAQYPKWSGKCLECDHWGTIKEESDAPSASPAARAGGPKAKAKETTSLKDIKAQDEHTRLSIGEHELDRVLGGGIVTGSVTLLSGEPGIGKSTLVAGMAAKIASQTLPPAKGGIGGGSVLYVSGEESATQLKSRFDRLNADLTRIKFLEMVSVEELVATLEKEKPTLAIVDSVQTMFSNAIEAQSGSPTLVRYATSCLLELAKRTGISLLLVGQVTKDGSVAGPKTLEHLVDTVLSLTGEPSHELRILEATKNRFGATDEIGVFEMTSEGLKAVENPSARFLAERVSVPGSVIATVREGSRIFLVEVQALVEKSFYGTPVRRANGMDQNRLQMLIAILSKRAGLHLGESDVYVNVVGGMQLKEPASDLAVCAAIMSAAKNRIDSEPVVYIGEVGLGGEIRNVMAVDKRVTEAKRVGIEKAVTPKTMKSVKEL
ncbi:MAG: DNA repair protein RadA [Candidatus Uhrbacteria bacterium]|nr:DNA repair protein RadA [Candidatus Uhrbacteria bacterium]